MENTNKKITKRDNFNKLLTIDAVIQDEQLVKFIEHELALLDKKSASHSTAKSANQKANDEIKKIIIDALAKLGKSTITELQTKDEEMGKYSNQKLSALLKQLVDSKDVIRTLDKKKAYFEITE